MIVFQLEAPYRGEYRLHRLRLGEGAPRVAVVAGIHGNEVNAIHAVNTVARLLQGRSLTGAVDLLPCVNTLAAQEGRKRWPFDDRDINGAFPGDPEGAPIERLAAAVMAATDAELVVDVQSGPPQTWELPHVRVERGGAAEALGRQAGLATWVRGPIGGLVDAWSSRGRLALSLRAGRGGALHLMDSEALANGVLRLLSAFGVLPACEPVVTPVFDAVADYRAPVGGFFVPDVRVGMWVEPGQRLGGIQTLAGGEPIGELRAEEPGQILALRVYPLVHARELIVRIGLESAHRG